MNENEISQLINQLKQQIQQQPSLGQKLENPLRVMKNKLEPEGKWTPELEARLRRSIELSN